MIFTICTLNVGIILVQLVYWYDAAGECGKRSRDLGSSPRLDNILSWSPEHPFRNNYFRGELLHLGLDLLVV